MKGGLKPLIALSIMLGLTIGVLFLGLSEEQRKNIFSLEDPLKVQQEKEALKETEEIKEEKPIEEIITSVNKRIDAATSIYCRVYKNGFLYKNNIYNFGMDAKNKVYTKGEDYYIDLETRIIYFLDNGKWYKKPLEEPISLDKSEYIIPANTKQLENEKIDGTNCYVLLDQGTNKKYYIKKSTEEIFCISEAKDNNTYYYQISFQEITINEKIKETAQQNN